MILNNGYVSLDGTDVSDKVRSISTPRTRETHDDSAMGDETRLFESGVKDGVPEYRQILKDLGFKAKKVDAGLAGGITASDILKKIS